MKKSDLPPEFQEAFANPAIPSQLTENEQADQEIDQKRLLSRRKFIQQCIGVGGSLATVGVISWDIHVNSDEQREFEKYGVITPRQIAENVWHFPTRSQQVFGRSLDHFTQTNHLETIDIESPDLDFMLSGEYNGYTVIFREIGNPTSSKSTG